MTTVVNPVVFNKPTDIADYWKQLVNAGMDYHIDDNPETTIWEAEISDDQLNVLMANHEAMWNYCEQNQIQPWDYISIEYISESICQEAVKKLAEWIVLRQAVINYRTVGMWIRYNYPDHVGNEYFREYLLDNYFKLIELESVN